MRVGELSKIPERGWNRTEKRGGEALILKRGQAGSRSGFLTKGGLEPPNELCSFGKAMTFAERNAQGI